MSAHPDLTCPSANFDSLALTWHGKARLYKVEYRRINEVSTVLVLVLDIVPNVAIDRIERV